MQFSDFEHKVREVATPKYPWLDDPQLRDLQWSFIRRLFWIYRKRNAPNIAGFILSRFREDGANAERARIAIQPVAMRSGAHLPIDDRAFRAFIDPANRNTEEPKDEVRTSDATAFIGLSDSEIIDRIVGLSCISRAPSKAKLSIAERSSLPKDYMYFLERHGPCEFSDAIALIDPWLSDKHVKGSAYWVIGKYWMYADGDDLLLDPISGNIFVYLHEKKGSLELFSPTFTRALIRLAEEAHAET